MQANMPTQAPTIAAMKAKGLAEVCPVCGAAQHSGVVAFVAIGLPDSTLFPCLYPVNAGTHYIWT